MRWPALRWIFRLRPEEAIGAVFLIPTSLLAVVLGIHQVTVTPLGIRCPGSLVRLGVAGALVLLLAWALRVWPRSLLLARLRETLPSVWGLLTYMSLHETIAVINPHDIHGALARIDGFIFGVQPSVWAESFVNPTLTEVMQLFYLNFIWLGMVPATSLLLLIQGRRTEFRRATMGIVLCFYLGYVMYLAFPAAPPRLALAGRFAQPLGVEGGAFTGLASRMFAALPLDSRGAFPSLHAAVSLLVVIYAWRYLRAWLFVIAPFVAALWVSTIYLRHHYVIDLVAGWVLAPIALVLAPRLDAWWATRQFRFGYEPAWGVTLERQGGAPSPPAGVRNGP